MKRTISSALFAATMCLAFSMSASPSWAKETENSTNQPTKISYRLTKDQIEQFSLDSMDVGNPAPTGVSFRSSYGYYPGGMNAEEAKFCAQPWNWGSCSSAKSAADDALARAKKKFDASTLYQGKGDAYRHCYWSARMTIDMGESQAKGFGDRHESESSGADKSMDLANNATGRSVGKSYKTYDTASNRCEWLARNGKLVTLK